MQGPGYAAVDRESHRAAGPSYAMLNDPRADPLAAYRAWLGEVEAFAQLEEDWRPAWAAEQEGRLDTVSAALATLEAQGHPSAAELRGRAGQARERLAVLMATPLVEVDRAERSTERVAIEAAVDDLRQAVDRVVQADAVEGSIRGLRGVETIGAAGERSAAVDGAWRRYRDGLIRRAERDGGRGGDGAGGGGGAGAIGAAGGEGGSGGVAGGAGV